VTIEQAIFDALKTLFGNRVFPDTAPERVAKPYATYQQIGGPTLAFMEGGAAPDHRHLRFQINVWSTTRTEASAKALAVDDVMRAATQFQAEPVGESIARKEDAVDPPLYGAQQDFMVWCLRVFP
jgi:hypothetical protein